MSIMNLKKLTVKPLAFDSFSVRSMSTAVAVGKEQILIDPGVALGPIRFGLPPSNKEEEALEKSRKVIMEEASKSKVIVISHYHYDHYPFPEDEEMNKIFRNKILIVKDKIKINKSQAMRERVFEKKIKDEAEEFNFADGKIFHYSSFDIKISEPVPHGPDNTKLGFVIMTKIMKGNESVLHASDVQGPISVRTADLIIKENPNLLIIDGPPTYLMGYRMPWKLVKTAEETFLRIVEKTGIKRVILDHHLLRDLNYKEHFKVYEKSKELGCKVETAAEFLGLANKQLEAHRKELSSKY